jgi:LIVCS family branched-chain amino acid:cation transporter
MKSTFLLVMSTGFALFSMFFGSGNLVFPLTVGLESEGHYFAASLGVLCTCVVFPLLGMLGILLYKGDVSEFFSCFGNKGVFAFSLVALALMGPFGVLARCLTVMHGALGLLVPSLSLSLASAVLCFTVYLLAVNKNKIVTLLGAVLTPFLLLAVGAIVFFGLKCAPLQEVQTESSLNAFANGFFKGYQTMDLVASFFFSGFVLKHLFEVCHDRGVSLKIFLKSSAVGALLLYAVYFALVLLGWLYAPMLVNTPAQEMFGKVATHALGSMAAPCVCVAVVLACLTTAIALTSLFADFLQKEVAKEKISKNTALVVTLGIAFLVSNLEFSGIANFLGPILEMMYPALIVLTVVNIGCKLCNIASTHWPWTVSLFTKLYLMW